MWKKISAAIKNKQIEEVSKDIYCVKQHSKSDYVLGFDAAVLFYFSKDAKKLPEYVLNYRPDDGYSGGYARYYIGLGNELMPRLQANAYTDWRDTPNFDLFEFYIICLKEKTPQRFYNAYLRYCRKFGRVPIKRKNSIKLEAAKLDVYNLPTVHLRHRNRIVSLYSTKPARSSP